MRLPSVVPDLSEILRGMSIASDLQDELISADDYLQPHSYVNDHRRPSHPLRRVSTAYYDVYIFVYISLVMACALSCYKETNMMMMMFISLINGSIQIELA